MARRSLSASAATLLLVAALLCAGAQAAPRRLMGSDLTVVPVRRLLENDGCPGIGTDDFGTTRKFATCEADGKLVSALATADADGNLLTLSMGCSNGNATVPAEGELFAACPVNATVIEMSGTFSNVTSTTVNSLSITCAPLNDLASNTTAIVLPLPALTPNGSIPFTFTNFEGFNTVWTDYQQPPVLISKLGLCGRATEPAPVLV